MRAKVDILLTYWGDFSLLEKTVESVFAQTERDWRLLVFDDCYPSNEAAQYFSKISDKRVNYYRHEKNLGITRNFNYALDSAEAEFCILLGCDDLLLPKYLETALNHIGSADFYQPLVDVIDKDGLIYLPIADRIKRIMQPRKSGIYKGEKLAASLCHGNWLYFPSIMWRTKTAQRYRFNSKYRVVEDVALELNIIKDGGSLFFDREITFQYRRFSQSVSSKEKSKTGVRFSEEDDVYAHFAKVFKKIGWNKAALAARLRITSRLHRIAG